MRAQGYAQLVDFDGKTVAECDTFTCCHCNRVVRLGNADGTKKQGVAVHCTMCGRVGCVPCAETGRCEPFEKLLDAIENRGRLFDAAGIAR
jgi:hypothetical protein